MPMISKKNRGIPTLCSKVWKASAIFVKNKAPPIICRQTAPRRFAKEKAHQNNNSVSNISATIPRPAMNDDVADDYTRKCRRQDGEDDMR